MFGWTGMQWARSRDGGDQRLVAFVMWYGMGPGLLCCEGLVFSFQLSDIFGRLLRGVT